MVEVSSSHPAGLSENPSVPQDYGRTVIVLMPRDPEWMFTYWEIQSQTLSALREKFGSPVIDASRPVFRVYEVHDPQAPSGGARLAFDIGITLEARNWYIHVPHPGGTWYVELGLLTSDGRFLLLARSNKVALPLRRVSDVTDAQWMAFRGQFEKLVEFSGVGRIGRGSLEMAKMLAQRWEHFQAVSSWAGSPGASGGAFAARAPFQRGFWLRVDCEVILYGATDPAARVKVAGKEIPLNPDGTFSVRMALPDGTVTLPVEAVSKDASEARRVEVVVERRTPVKET